MALLARRRPTSALNKGRLAPSKQKRAQALGTLGAQQAQEGAALGNIGAQQGTLGTQQGQLGTAYGAVGTQAQQAGLQGAAAQTQAGTIPQTEQQAIDTALQNDWTQGQAYPFQTTGFLGNIIEGTGSESGGTSSSTSPGPSALGQGVGLATAGLGALSNPAVTSGIGAAAAGLAPLLAAFARGGRITGDRENVASMGKTFDGRPIQRFNYKGDPREHYDAGGGVSPGQLYDLGVGKASPAGALALMDPGSGAGAGTGAFGAGALSRTPGARSSTTPRPCRIGLAPSLSRWRLAGAAPRHRP